AAGAAQLDCEAVQADLADVLGVAAVRVVPLEAADRAVASGEEVVTAVDRPVRHDGDAGQGAGDTGVRIAIGADVVDVVGSCVQTGEAVQAIAVGCGGR